MRGSFRGGIVPVLLLLLLVSIALSGITVTGDYFGQKKPGLSPELFAPGIISTPAYEHGSPAFSRDGNIVFWTQLLGAHGSEAVIKFMTRKDGIWSAPRRAEIFGGFDDMYPHFNADESRIFVSSGIGKDGTGQAAERRIWFIEKEKAGWSKPRSVGFDSLDIYGLCVARDRSLYFMARSSANPQQYDLYLSVAKDGAYADPAKLPPPIDTENYEDNPCLSPDESCLVFESNRPGGAGKEDLYVCFREPNGAWTEPRNLGPTVNTPANERFPGFSPDGRYLFFGSDRGGNFDIYWVDARVLENLKPGATK